MAIDITEIVQGGSNRVKVYHKIVTTQPSGTVAFLATDIISYLQEYSGIGAKSETTEGSLYHSSSKFKLNTSKTANDVSFTEAMTTDALEDLRDAFDDDSFMVVGIFSEDGDLIYGCFGQISEWGMELPDGEFATITYTLTVSDDKVVCTEPTP